MPSPSSYCQNPFLQYHNWRRHILFAVSFIHPIRCWLCCHDHNLLLSSYLQRISWKEKSTCRACGHPLQDLNHLLLCCPTSEPLCKSIFGSSLFLIYGLDLGVWPDCLVSAEFLHAPIPWKGSGGTTTTYLV